MVPNDLVKLIRDYDSPAFSYVTGIDMNGLAKYVKPETDILSLVMLSKARNQGLDVVFIDDDKFFDGSFNKLVGELLNGTGPFDGAWYIEFELAPILLHGQTFSLIDHSESMGCGVALDATNFKRNLISLCLQDTGKVDYGSLEDFNNIQTIQQLTDYVNRMLTSPEPKEPLYTRLPSLADIATYIVAAVVLMGVGIYYFFKYINRFYRYIKYLLNKPL